MVEFITSQRETEEERSWGLAGGWGGREKEREDERGGGRDEEIERGSGQGWGFGRHWVGDGGVNANK